jgi:hypothetical protein
MSERSRDFSSGALSPKSSSSYPNSASKEPSLGGCFSLSTNSTRKLHALPLGREDAGVVRDVEGQEGQQAIETGRRGRQGCVELPNISERQSPRDECRLGRTFWISLLESFVFFMYDT